MKVAVMGAGAVGCYYGGLLARAGHDVVLIGRPRHVDAINAHGLRFQTATFDMHIPMRASTETSAVAEADLVLFCVKSMDTPATARDMKPFLKTGALVLSLQNGVENVDTLRAALLDPDQLARDGAKGAASVSVAAAVVYVASAMGGDGHVIHHGRGELVIEPSPASDAVASALVAAGVPTEVSPDVREALWIKLMINCAYNALSAITQLPYGPLSRGEGIPETLRAVVGECLAVANAEGIAITRDIHADIARTAATMPGQRSSTAQDLTRGKLTEIDHLNGLIVRKGMMHGIDTPVNRTLHALVKLIEVKPGAAG
ncbi:2-dehydropantoate 2-reductase [Robbsia andropogonis]|uniref:2-dehydropantoate 2-reductase n=1 Tax=Robbsia andropogonis TaxID=28092 RepID=A0A0F5K3D8_9BURK|nr:2-dehydropantoate 2-reductase [Robbsia andropogonis]KKB64404.1 2-dehydropantoate 2-reductase [Robbsia andropogonis]